MIIYGQKQLAESVNPFKDKYFHGKKQSIGKTEETIFNSRPKKRPANRSICARLTDGSLRIIPPRQTDNGSAQVPLSFPHPVEKNPKKN